MASAATDVARLQDVCTSCMPDVSQHAQNATKEMTLHDLAFYLTTILGTRVCEVPTKRAAFIGRRKQVA